MIQRPKQSKEDIVPRERGYNLRRKRSKPDFFNAGGRPPRKSRVVKRAGTKEKKKRRKRRKRSKRLIPKVDRKKGEFQYTAENNTCCGMNCAEKITQLSREILRDKYLSIGDEKLQNIYLTTMVKRSLPNMKKRLKPNSVPRMWINKFYLFPDDNPVMVCKKFFKDTFNITIERFNSIITRDCIVQNESGIRSSPSKEDFDSGVLMYVKDHIKCYNFNITSDTSIDDHPSKYLSPGVNVRKMYRQYVMIRKKRGEVYVSECMYRKIFKEHIRDLIHNPEKAKRPSFTELNRRCWQTDQFRRLVEAEHSFSMRSMDMARKYLIKDDEFPDEDLELDD